MSNEVIFFLGFSSLVFIVLLFDLGLFNKHDHVISYREATAWTVLWVVLALCAYGFLRIAGERLHGIANMEELQAIVQQNRHHVNLIPGDFEASIEAYRQVISLEFITGYLVEYSLSIDNIFVMILIFSAFGVQKKLFHRVLFWGILGAVIARFIFIFGGGFLISKYSWVLYVFAVFLIYTGIKMFLTRNSKEEIDTHNHPVVKFTSKYFRVHRHFEGNKFFIVQNGKRLMTPLFLVLLIIEFSDIIFAVDSIPAIFAITNDTYIVFFSNIFAIMGLRSMFFLLLNVLDKLRFFKHGLSALLTFIGLKMIFHEKLAELGFSTQHALLVILVILGLSFLASWMFPEKTEA